MPDKTLSLGVLTEAELTEALYSQTGAIKELVLTDNSSEGYTLFQIICPVFSSDHRSGTADFRSDFILKRGEEIIFQVCDSMEKGVLAVCSFLNRG